MPQRIVVAMSGGVDSSVAAARLVAEGHDVIGVTLHLWDYPDDGSVRGRCCAPEDVHDARRVADRLGIPHFAFDRRELFQKEVVDPFVQSYLDGTTPSPCVRCNRGVKMAELIHMAQRFDASHVATGHYARIIDEEGAPRLHRGADHTKDQSYFLHMLSREQLAQLCFPLGEATKAEVRRQAAELSLPGAAKGESQELCFIAEGRYDEFVQARAATKVRPGPIVGPDGTTVGSHGGVHRFTVGQRKNLGVALGERLYVVAIDGDRGTVKLGRHEELLARGALLDGVTLNDDVSLPLACEVMVRYRAEPVKASVTLIDGTVVVLFETPIAAVVPGQYAVFVSGTRVFGGGLIKQALRSPVEGAAEHG